MLNSHRGREGERERERLGALHGPFIMNAELSAVPEDPK